MTYFNEDREESTASGDLPGRRRHSSDVAGAEQYVYQRPTDWTPRRRREQPAETPSVDWFGNPRPTWDEESATQARWETGRRGEGSAWDAEALRAAAGVPVREDHTRPADYDHPVGHDRAVGHDRPTWHDGTAQHSTAAIPPVPPAYAVPGQRRPAEQSPEYRAEAPGSRVEAEVPEAPPADPRRSLSRKNLILRLAAVLVLVFSGAVGVAVTVLRDTGPDTVQVKEELQADAPVAAASPDTTAGPDATAGPEQENTDLLAQQEQDAAVDAAKSRAADKATAAQKAAAKQAERAEDQRASRSAARKAAAAENDDSSSSSSSSSSSGGSSGDPVPAGSADCGSYSGNKKTGCSLLSEFGFATSQFGCLEKLWTKESGWRTTAENPSSGAYGIPQSLPGSKMATVAGDWRTNPATQIRWGLGYIKGRYGTPCAAWSHSQANNWY